MNDDDEARRRRIAENVARALGKNAIVIVPQADLTEIPAYDAVAIAQLVDLMPTRRRPRDNGTVEVVPMLPDEWAEYQEQQRRQFTVGLVGDIEYIMQDVALIAEMSDGLPVAYALQVLHEALTVALTAVQAQVEADRE